MGINKDLMLGMLCNTTTCKVLTLLSKDEQISTVELCKRSNCTKPYLLKVLPILEKQGLVIRPKKDEREKVIKLTDLGQSIKVSLIEIYKTLGYTVEEIPLMFKKK